VAARRVAVVGAGQAGLQLAFGLLERGYELTVLSDRTAEEILNGRVMANHVMFDTARSYERELGLDFWAGRDDLPYTRGLHFEFCPEPSVIALAMAGRLPATEPALAVDTRLKYARWFAELERRGGTLVHRSATLEDVDDLTATHDLVFVAAGKGEISALFERDDDKSTYDAPQRKLALVVVRGAKPSNELVPDPVRFVFTATDGEFFWSPFFHKSEQPMLSTLFEPRPGTPLDRFDAAGNAEEMLVLQREIVAEYAPWAAETFADAEVADPLAWAKGALTPVVRKPVGTLPSGRKVMALGDTAILNDPIAGQGANCASKMAHFVTARILERGASPLDAAWMEETFEAFWESDGRFITGLSNMLLEPPTPPALELLGAASQSPPVGDDFIRGFDNPQQFWPWIEDLELTRRHIAEVEAAAQPEAVA
jgi:2-polyprenyl-6-methoxyphenol hydroxylase-like FAD-dependent oxidoreductase